MFICYAHHSASYRFFVTKNDNNVMEVNNIVEIKNAEFFEHVFPLKTHVDKLLMRHHLVMHKNLMIMKKLN